MTTVIRGATLIDGTGADPVTGATVVVEENRIISVGRDIDVPRGATVIDVAGMTVMPQA